MSAEIIQLPRRQRSLTQLRDEIYRKVRLDKDLPHLFAVNLGRLAAKLDPEKPARGARRMFARRFGEDECVEPWRRRKRLLRLPGEDAAVSKHSRDYESRGENYVLLAESYADLVAPGSGNARELAILDLVRGTRLDPNPGAPTSLEGLELARSTLREIAQAVAADGVAGQAFRILARYPVAAYSKSEVDQRVESSLSHGLLQPYENLIRSPRTTGNFSFLPLHDCTLNDNLRIFSKEIPWCIPRVLIGYAYHPWQYDVYVLSLKDKKGEKLLEKDKYEILQEQLIDAIRNEFPEIYEGYVRYCIYAAIFPDSNSSPNLVFFAHSDPFEFDGLLEIHEIERKQVYERGRAPSHDILFESERFFELLGPEDEEEDFAPFFWVKERPHDPRARYIAFLQASLDELSSISPWLSACYVGGDNIIRLLEVGSPSEDEFSASVWDEPARFAKAPQLSVAATIIRNHRHAPPGHRIVDMLVEDARIRLKPFLDFMEMEAKRFDEDDVGP